MKSPALIATIAALAAIGSAPLAAQDPDLDDLEELDALEGLDDLDGEHEGGLRLTGIEGFFETRGVFYFRDRNGQLHDEQWITEIQLELDFAIGDRWSAYFRPRFLIDAVDDDLVRTDPLEAHVTWSEDSFDLRAGMMVENWGIADTFNPVDVLNRRDLATDPLDPERLGELGARLRLLLPGGDTIGEPTVSFYAMPVFQSAEFPTEESRYSFAPSPNRLREDAHRTPSGGENAFLAARVQATVSTAPANADVQLVMARGPERFPIFSLRPNGAGLDLFPIYYGVWTTGGGVRAVPNADLLADYTLKAEWVYKVPYRTSRAAVALPDDYLQYAIGVDRLFPNIFSDHDQLTATVEWVGETGANDSTSRFRPFDDDLVVRGFWEANDFARTSVELRALWDPSSNEYVIESILERQLRALHEDLQLRLGVQVFDPARSRPGFFALFPNNSNAEVALRFEF